MTRWAVSDDASDLARAHICSWQRAYAGILPVEFLDGLDLQMRTRWWRQFIENGAHVHVVGDPVVGFCHTGDSDETGWGEVFSIYVHPDRWGEGLGRDLLRAGCETMREMGHGRALLWVLRDNERARKFYERQAWAVGKPIRVEEIGGLQVTEVRYETVL